MGSTFMGIEIARRGISAHQSAMQTTGHNISNADNDHYARQRVEMGTMKPLYDPALNRAERAGMIGQGVEVSAITRTRDEFIDDRIIKTQQQQSFWETKQKYLHQTEIIFNEPSEESLRTQLDRFWQSWQELSQYPEEMSHREQVRTRGEELAHRTRDTFRQLHNLRRQADSELQTTVERLNEFAGQVRDLNEKILKSKTLGDRPNDLMDKRDALLQKMSELADVSVERQDPDELVVYLGGHMLVQGEAQNKLQLKPSADNEGLHNIVWEHTGKEATFSDGKIKALLDVRDQLLKESIEKIDSFATNVADIVNDVHQNGFGLTKETGIRFFDIQKRASNVNGNVDLNGDGTNDTTAVFKMAGRNEVQVDRPVGAGGTLTFQRNNEESTPVYITYRPDETLKQVIDRINRSEAGVTAHVNHENNLVLKGLRAEDDADENFMIRHVEDSGELLVGYAGLLQNSGTAGAFDYQRTDETTKLQSNDARITLTPTQHPAGAIQLSDSIEGNVSLIAAAQGKDVGGTGSPNQAHGAKDGSNALKIAQALRHEPTMVGDHENVDQFYNALVSKLGVEARTAKDNLENQQSIMKNLENMRQSVMGVNLDEEMSNMVQFQHGYNASARMLQTMNEMLDRLINGLR